MVDLHELDRRPLDLDEGHHFTDPSAPWATPPPAASCRTGQNIAVARGLPG